MDSRTNSSRAMLLMQTKKSKLTKFSGGASNSSLPARGGSGSGSDSDIEQSSDKINRSSSPTSFKAPSFGELLESTVAVHAKQRAGKQTTAMEEGISSFNEKVQGLRAKANRPSVMKPGNRFKAALFAPGSANAELIEQLCDLKRCEFKDTELENEFVQSKIRNSVRRNGYLTLFVALYDLIAISLWGVPPYWLSKVSVPIFIAHHFLTGIAAFWSTKKNTTVALKVRDLWYRYTVVVTALWLTSVMVLNFGYQIGFSPFIVSSESAVLFNSATSFYLGILSFICVQVIYHHRVRPQVYTFILMFIVLIIVQVAFNPSFSTTQAVIITLVSASTTLKTLLVTGLFKYRQRISERLLFFHKRAGISIEDHSTQGTATVIPDIEEGGKSVLERLKQKSEFFKPADFNLFHDETRRQEIFISVLRMLGTDALLSLLTFSFGNRRLWIPSLVKSAIIVSTACCYSVFRKLLGDRAGPWPSFWFNVVSVLAIIINGLAFLMDAVWSLALLGLDDWMLVLVKPVSLFSTLASNSIGTTCSGLRLPWSTFVSISSFGLALALRPLSIPLIPQFSNVIAGPYFLNKLSETLLYLAVLIVVLYMEGRHLNKLYFKTYDNLVQFQKSQIKADRRTNDPRRIEKTSEIIDSKGSLNIK